MQMMGPDMSMVGKTQGNQDKLPSGGPRAEWREVRRRQNSPTREEHWPSSRWRCAQGRTRVSWKAIQGFEVKPGRPPSGHR